MSAKYEVALTTEERLGAKKTVILIASKDIEPINSTLQKVLRCVKTLRMHMWIIYRIIVDRIITGIMRSGRW